MADPATRSVAPDNGTTITSARYGAGPPIVLVGGAFQYRAVDPPPAGPPKLPGAGFKVFHVSRIASAIGTCTGRQPPPPCAGRGDWRQRCAR